MGRKSEVESLVAAAFEQRWPEIVGNEYLVFGVLERSDWLRSKEGELCDTDTAQRAIVCKPVLEFRPVGGWVFDPKARRQEPGSRAGPRAARRKISLVAAFSRQESVPSITIGPPFFALGMTTVWVSTWRESTARRT
jgi:hypothetical protein